MITDDDRVKILDFGVAKFFEPLSTQDPERATTTQEESQRGMAVGTAGYMSPEQALGRTLDARTDLFALGVVLFEMATGRAPFAGDTAAAVFDHLLNRPPPSLLTLNPALPRSARGDHRQGAREGSGSTLSVGRSSFCAICERVDASTSPSARRRQDVHGRRGMSSSIVVLPFVDMSPEKDQEYFCHGITEEIINTLTRVPGVRVISRTSAFAFQGKDLEVTEIGRRLRVGTALEGSVRKAGDRVRVTAQLVNAEDGYQIWSKRFDRELSDVFAIQDEIAASILDEFRIASLTRRQPERGSLNVPAHDAYLKGMYALNKWTDDGDAAGHRRLQRSHRRGCRLCARVRRPGGGSHVALLRGWAFFQPARRCPTLDGRSTRRWRSTRPRGCAQGTRA